MGDGVSDGSGSSRERRLLASLAGLCLALLAGCGLLGWKLASGGGGAVFFGEDALRDPDLRREIVRKLTAGNVHPFDSHPDPEVGRLLVADGERDGFSSNAIGIRERPFELQKPDGVVRIILLGDSYVFGLNIADGDRLGAVLEGELGRRAAAPAPRFEVLHMAVNSWNIASECAFLRRQIDQIRPDLVLQVTYSNDLDDVTGVRGFGSEASFAPRHRARADSLVLDRYAQSFLGHDTRNFLSRGLEHESRTRFADALAAVRRLRATMAALPDAPRHVFVVHWGPLAPVIHEHLGSKLAPDSVLYLPLDLATDKSVWITPSDPHWNPAGHARVARFLYGIIRTRGLLPQVELGAWPKAEQSAEDWARRGLEFARDNLERVNEMLRGEPVAMIDLPEITREEARQVHGGLDREGLVSPYASLVLLRAPGTTELHVRGSALPDLALAGTQMTVSLEELELETLGLSPGQPFELRLPIPAALEGRKFLNLRFESDDYAYRGTDLRHCVSFRLERAALE